MGDVKGHGPGSTGTRQGSTLMRKGRSKSEAARRKGRSNSEAAKFHLQQGEGHHTRYRQSRKAYDVFMVKYTKP